MTDKQKRSYKTISEVVKILNTNKKISSNSQSHTLRFWEKQFKQIKPIKINNRRYYDQKNIDMLIRDGTNVRKLLYVFLKLKIKYPPIRKF